MPSMVRLNMQQVKLNPLSFIVVATQGEQDEEALLQALQKQTAYIGFVASKKKRSSVFEYIRQSGIEEKKIAMIHSPAGIDINAKKPEEVAISILAEIIQVQHNPSSSFSFTHFDTTRVEAGKPAFYINPVCGVPIDINNPKHIIDYYGEKVYFCCDGCKVKFETDPEKYMNKAPAS